MEHRMPLGHLPLPSRDTLQMSWGIICSRHTATKHPAPAKLLISPQGSHSSQVHGQRMGPRVCWKKEQTSRLFPQARSPQGQGVHV